MQTKGAVVAFCVLIPAVVAAQSLGEVAKKEKKRRQGNQAKGVKVRVIREVDLSQGKPKPPEESGGTASKAGPAAVSSNDTKTSSPDARATSAASASSSDRRKQEIAWRQRVSEARARLKAAKERYDALAGLHLTPGEYYVDENGEAVITSLDQLRRMVAEAKAELDKATKALEDLQEEARKAGVPPGWLR